MTLGGNAGPRLPVDRHQADQPHQPAHPLDVHRMPFGPQVQGHLEYLLRRCACFRINVARRNPQDRFSTVSAIRGHSRRCPTSPGTTVFNTTRTLRRMLNGTAYLDRAAPRFTLVKFFTLAFMRGLFIEFGPGSNCPGWIIWSGRSALASRFLAFCAAFAFARWRALALVMSSSPGVVTTPEVCTSRPGHQECSCSG